MQWDALLERITEYVHCYLLLSSSVATRCRGAGQRNGNPCPNLGSQPFRLHPLPPLAPCPVSPYTGSLPYEHELDQSPLAGRLPLTFSCFRGRLRTSQNCAKERRASRRFLFV